MAKPHLYIAAILVSLIAPSFQWSLDVKSGLGWLWDVVYAIYLGQPQFPASLISNASCVSVCERVGANYISYIHLLLFFECLFS